MANFKGIFTAQLTPFDKNDKINDAALEKLIKHNIDMGVSGFYVGGSTAEAFHMTTDERKYLLEAVRAIAKDKTIIAHIGTLNQNEAIDLAKHAEKVGADAISSVAPFYYKMTFNEIKDYYFGVADSVNIPMFVYNFPMNTGVTMTIKEFDQFFENDKFLGFKHTSSDFFTLERVKAKYPEKIALNGFDEMFLGGIVMGADGGIGSTYNFMANKFVKIMELVKEGKIEEAREIQHDINKVVETLFSIELMPAQKEVLNQLGFDFGNCRKPFRELTTEEKKIIEKEILPLL
ncbi:MAG: N-acetylneuraminate lyase [Clostridia bacterium]|nr:N-acetylneuraminate lyase [Clostridia bacterium]